MFNLKTMKPKLMILLLASVVVITSVHSEPKKSDSDAIQGQWQGTEKDAAPDQHSSLTITGKNLEFHGVDTNEVGIREPLPFAKIRVPSSFSEPSGIVLPRTASE